MLKIFWGLYKRKSKRNWNKQQQQQLWQDVGKKCFQIMYAPKLYIYIYVYINTIYILYVYIHIYYVCTYGRVFIINGYWVYWTVKFLIHYTASMLASDVVLENRT